ncbi:MAG: hypothetical protein U0175_28460 [Caldilineaceae bacterium]
MKINMFAQRAGVLIVSLILCLLPQPTQAQNTPSTPSPECQATYLSDSWNGDFTISYDISETYDNGSPRSGEAHQSGNLSLVFAERSGDASYATWRLKQAGGSGVLHSRYIEQKITGPHEKVIDGSGVPVGFIGHVEMEAATCSYSVEVFAYINVTVTETDSVPQQEMMDLAIFRLYDQPFDPVEASAVTLQAPDRAKPRQLQGNVAIKVPVVPSVERKTQFMPGLSSVDTANLMRLKGRPDLGTAGVGWTLTPNPSQPYIASVEIKHKIYPTSRWGEVGQLGTVDGNLVQITANLYNPTDTLYPVLALRFLDAESKQPFPGCDIRTALSPKRITPIVCEWDTQGYAWDAPWQGHAGTKHPSHFVRVELGGKADPLDIVEKSITIRPKPLILVPGEYNNPNAWLKFQRFIVDANEYWTGYVVPGLRTSDNPLPWAHEKRDTIATNADVLVEYVRQVRLLENAWHVDIVAHGVGGLIARRYIYSNLPTNSDTARPVIHRLVMLGTPNRGSDCATAELVLALKFDLPDLLKIVETLPAAVDKFNEEVNDLRGVIPAALGGNQHNYRCAWPFTAPSDDFVTYESATWRFGNVAATNSSHLEMIKSQQDFDNFVWPQLADSHDGGGLLAQSAEIAPLTPNSTSDEPGTMDNVDQQPLATQFVSQTVAAQRALDLHFAVPTARAVAVTLVASSNLTSTLLRPDGSTQQVIAAESAEAEGWWRTMVISNPIPGTWTLRLANGNGASEGVVAFLQVVEGPATINVAHTQADEQGKVTVTAQINGLTAAANTLQLSLRTVNSQGLPQTLPLLDDGQHNDGSAGDGLCGTSVTITDLIAAFVVATLGDQSYLLPVQLDGAASPTAHRSYLPLLMRP